MTYTVILALAFGPAYLMAQIVPDLVVGWWVTFSAIGIVLSHFSADAA